MTEYPSSLSPIRFPWLDAPVLRGCLAGFWIAFEVPSFHDVLLISCLHALFFLLELAGPVPSHGWKCSALSSVCVMTVMLLHRAFSLFQVRTESINLLSLQYSRCQVCTHTLLCTIECLWPIYTRPPTFHLNTCASILVNTVEIHASCPRAKCLL